MKSTLVWVRIPGLPMDFWSKHAIKAIGNEIGTTILVYDSFITSGKHSMARFFMDQDIMKDPYEYLELILGPRRYTQPLHSTNEPFQCARCHAYGHIVVDYSKSFIRKVWQKVYRTTPKS